jgi:Lipocalin-like domain
VTSVSHADFEPLTGSWRLVSVEATFTDTGERVATFGPAPNGRMVLTPAGRIMFLITKSERQPPATDAARATMFNETIAYSGQVRLEGQGKFITTVEISLFPEEIGTEKLRLFALDGDHLVITRPEQTSRVTKGRRAVSNLVWQREPISLPSA